MNSDWLKVKICPQGEAFINKYFLSVGQLNDFLSLEGRDLNKPIFKSLQMPGENIEVKNYWSVHATLVSGTNGPF